MKSSSHHYPRFFQSATVVLAALWLAAGTVSAATYTYSETSSTNTNWSVGTSWDAVPVSAADTILTFTSPLDDSDPPVIVPLAAGTNIVSNNDIAGNFLLNRLNFTYTGATSGTVPTVTISGNPLEFTGANATFNFSPPGTGNLSLTVSNNLVLSSNLAISTGTANNAPWRAVRFDGAISGAGNLTFSWGAGSPAAFILSNPSNSYAGDTRLTHSSTMGRTYLLRLGASEVIPNGVGKGNVYLSDGSEASGPVLDLYGYNETINGLSSNLPPSTSNASAMVVRNGLSNSTSTLTLGDNDASGAYYGGIQSTSPSAVLNLTKIGSGTQVLASSGNQTGTTTVSQGTLKIDFSQRATSQTTNPVNYFSAASGLILAGGATFAIEGRRDGEAVSHEAATSGSAFRTFSLPNSVADRLTVGQGITMENATSSVASWIVALNRGVTTTTVSVNQRTISGLTSISTVNETATTSQTLSRLTLSGAADSVATLDFGASDNVVLTINAAPIQTNDGSRLNIVNWSGIPLVGGGAERLMFLGAPTDFSDILDQDEVIFDGYEPGYALIAGDGVYEVVAIPEPGMIGLLAAGALLLRVR